MILAHFVQTWPRRRSEWLLATIVAGLGVVYTLSPHLFDRPYFAAMRGLMPQQMWALACILIGATRLAFLLINGTMLPLSPAVRFVMSAISSSIWVGLTIAAVLNEYAAQSLAIWPVLLFFEGIVAFETSKEWGASMRRGPATGVKNAASGC